MAVEFEEEQLNNTFDLTMARTHSSHQTHSDISLTRVLIKKGVFKNEHQAKTAFLTVALVSLVSSAFILGYFVFNIGRPQETRLQVPPQVEKFLNRQ